MRSSDGFMRIVIISDTHERHQAFPPLEGDVLIHCGDMFELMDTAGMRLEDMDRWFGEQRFDLVLCTGGNHDIDLELALERHPQPFSNAVYLQDEGCRYGNLLFWGAPWVPQLAGHAFYADEDTLNERWARIPEDTDVLITHTPPASILDASSAGISYGCTGLLPHVLRSAPRLHCFGHVHNSRGQYKQDSTLFVNASSVRSSRPGVLPPIVVEL